MTCNATSFPRSLTHTECWGLTATPSDGMGRPITDAVACLSYCCGVEACTLWNFKESASPPCWTWLRKQPPVSCQTVAGWAGGGGRHAPPAPPAPPAGGSQSIVLPSVLPSPSPLRVVDVNTRNPSGVTLSADSVLGPRSEPSGCMPDSAAYYRVARVCCASMAALTA